MLACGTKGREFESRQGHPCLMVTYGLPLGPFMTSIGTKASGTSCPIRSSTLLLSTIGTSRFDKCGQTVVSSGFATVQITFIFIDFRVCDFAFAFKTQNAPCVSRFKRVLFSDRFQFAF